jgi:glutamyl-tRNA reductase
MLNNKKSKDLKIVAVKLNLDKLANSQEILSNMSFWIRDRKDSSRVLKALKEFAKEEIVVQKCNSVEIYLILDKESLYSLKEVIQSIWKKFSKKFNESIFKNNVEFYYGKKAIQHIIETSLGIKSVTLGDSQVFVQLKKAWKFSKDNRFSGPMLNELFETIIIVNKLVDTETEFHRGKTSIERLITEIISKKINRHSNIALIGGGSSGELIAKCLYEKGFTNVFLFSRNREFLINAVKKYKFTKKNDRFLMDNTKTFEVVILCTNINKNFSRRFSELEEKIRDNTMVIDISVPNLINEKSAKRFNFYNINSIRRESVKTIKKRSSELRKVNTIIKGNINPLKEIYL